MPKKAIHKASNLPEGWEFIDGQASHAANPTTFECPNQAEAEDMVKGDFVKIGIRNEGLHVPGKPNGERFWTIIHSRKKLKTKVVYRAEINNDLFVLPQHFGDKFVIGDIIEFEGKHVLSSYNKNKNFKKHRQIEAGKN